MTGDATLYPRARIPYGTWGSSYFPAWQMSALAEVNIGQFAGESMARIMGMKGVKKTELDYLVIGSTIPWHWKFWTAPLVARAGADVLVAGSAVFKGGSVENPAPYGDNIRAIKAALDPNGIMNPGNWEKRG